MRINEHIPFYLLEANGTVLNMQTGEIEQKINATEYRLQTSENVFLETKDKPIELVRRFTDAQIKKLYDTGVEYKSVSENPEKTPSATRSIGSKTTFVKNATATISVDSKNYTSLRQASDELGLSKDIINRRIKSGDYPTYFKIE